MISIIVPVYKVEDYLPKCIESLMNQTYQDIQIILVDDGSPDNCGVICDKYAAEDNRIVVIHQQNSGVSAARNAGLAVAIGEYIGFCDSDDYVSPNMYQCLLDNMTNSKAQIAICGYDYVDETGKVTRPYRKRNPEVLIQQEIFRRFFDMPPTIRLCVWNKLFRRELFEGIQFRAGIKGAEDAEVLCEYLLRVNTAIFIHEPLYINCERQGSATRGGLKSDSVLPALDIYKEAWRKFEMISPEINRHAQAYYMDACLLNYSVHCVEQKAENHQLVQIIKERIRKEFPSALYNMEIFWKTRIYYLLFALGIKR
ncbi:MAG: glycosyltransferase [Eubacterium sp.]|nr:glycosyltransferase [Eubacterium sp.]